MSATNSLPPDSLPPDSSDRAWSCQPLKPSIPAARSETGHMRCYHLRNRATLHHAANRQRDGIGWHGLPVFRRFKVGPPRLFRRWRLQPALVGFVGP